jgi:hypothetical protein
MQNQKAKFSKISVKSCFHEIDLKIVHRKFVFLLFEISGETLAFSSPCAPFAMARCIFNGSTQCPNEATIFGRLRAPLSRSDQ